jgi:hypothetical protein
MHVIRVEGSTCLLQRQLDSKLLDGRSHRSEMGNSPDSCWLPPACARWVSPDIVGSAEGFPCAAPVRTVVQTAVALLSVTRVSRYLIGEASGDGQEDDS